MTDVTIVRICHRLAVDEHRRKGVQLLAHQHRSVRFQLLRRDVEVAEPAPIPLGDPKQLFFVGVFERVLYGAVRHQVKVIAGRDVGGILHVVGNVLQSPSAVERDHKTSARRERTRKKLFF